MGEITKHNADFDMFYEFENYYEVDQDDMKISKENETTQTSIFYEYIDIGGHLNYKKQWNGVN